MPATTTAFGVLNRAAVAAGRPMPERVLQDLALMDLLGFVGDSNEAREACCEPLADPDGAMLAAFSANYDGVIDPVLARFADQLRFR